jgi:hypothetical protein
VAMPSFDFRSDEAVAILLLGGWCNGQGEGEVVQ